MTTRDEAIKAFAAWIAQSMDIHVARAERHIRALLEKGLITMSDAGSPKLVGEVRGVRLVVDHQGSQIPVA